ncbi:pre-peptidase C-terminal domain-containing protein [Chitinophaga nivalis]|uniref:Pre-peptidase C-terminal domain-containing protein n=1 Tax=Chitinophaga nivalis TaxID=2991709 RepID=A0ABT3IQ98_9BACT|nr:pre-peptidase C-terminal domain-containing protein [Chitinophaga nivalis]MCW3464163.1 pre-peptidase C-terminal domain-containing protein [Chitinophaga nivalis]MCW3486147.1 pre-peptidase C-terminal domain-containing protein [Chitinophaga nivalis]
MKRTLSILMGLLLAAPVLHAQVSKGGKPYSFGAGFVEKIDTRSIAASPVDKLRKEDEKNLKQGLPLRVGVIVPVTYSPATTGTWTSFPNGDRVWRLKIQVDGALATSLYYQNFHLPAGATLFVYNEDHSQLIGGYTSDNNQETGLFATEILNGNTCILEYYEPNAVKGQGRFTISGVNNIYSNRLPESRSRSGNIDKDLGDAGSCNVNVNCPEGANWQNQKRAVARILFKNGGSSYLCSGSLVNNARNNCKPYFLTANHCGSNASDADFNQWIFYFNFEAPSCSNPASAPSANTITGCVQRARSGNAGGVEGSDFQLLEFNQAVPASYNVYYAGWNANTAASPSGVSIHHPAGDIKKISTYTAALTESNYSGTGSAPYSHWKAVWVQTQTNWSITEGGSSGSPLFNNLGQIVGQLSGGPSSCGATPANKNDLYGKVARSWISNGTDALHQLKPWLDPDNTGVLQLNGSNYPCNDTTNPQTCPDPYEPNNSLAAASTIASGTDIRAKISPATDTDYFKIQLTDTSRIAVALDNLPANYNLRLLSANGTQLAVSQNSGNTAEAINYNAGPGTYYLQVIGVGGAFSDSICYRLNATATVVNNCTESYEPNETRTAAAAISANTTVTSQISTATDKDWYKFSNTSSQKHIEITLTNLPGDYDVILYNNAGTELGRSANASTSDERIVYNNGAVGNYYIQVFGYSGANSTTKCYKLLAATSSTPKQAPPASKNSKDEKAGRAGITVYPVPATDRVYVEFNSNKNELQRVTISDISGKVLYNQQHSVLNGYNRLEVGLPSAWKSGTYIISTGKNNAKQFLLQR